MSNMVDPRPPKFIFPALVTVTLIAPLAVHMFIPALPVVKAELDVSDSMAFSTISLVMIVMAFATVVYGGFSDQWGRKPVLLTGLALYTIGAELSWFATDIYTLLAGRILQASGAGCGVVLARAIARDIYGLERIAPVIANLTAAYVLGPTLAPPLGGFMIDGLGWRSIFMLAAFIGLILILLVALYFPETHKPAKRLPGTNRIIVTIWSDYRALLSVPRFTAYALAPGFLSGTFFALATSSAFLATEGLKMPVEEFGLWFLFLPAGFMTGNFISGRIGNRASISLMTISGSLLNVCIVLTMSAILFIGGLSIYALVIPGFMLGIAQGMCLPYAQAGAMHVNPALAGSASGAVTFSQLMVAGISQQICGIVADTTWVPIAIVMFIFSILGLGAAIVAAFTQPKKD